MTFPPATARRGLRFSPGKGCNAPFVSRWLARRRELLNRRLAAGPAERSILREEYLPGRQPRGWSSRFDLAFQRMVEHAGLNLDASFVLGMIVLCGAILGAFMFVWRQDEEPWLALPAFLLGAAIPVLLLLWRQQAWRRTLRQQLPDAVFLLARSLRAGRSIDQAFEVDGITSPVANTAWFRPLEFYTETLCKSGFAITSLTEPHPSAEQVRADNWWRKGFTRPLFMLVAAQKMPR